MLADVLTSITVIETRNMTFWRNRWSWK